MPYPPKIQELVDCPCELLTAAQIAPLVSRDQNTLRYLARYHPEKLPFVSVASKDERRVRFVKQSVLSWLGYQLNSSTSGSRKEDYSG